MNDLKDITKYQNFAPVGFKCDVLFGKTSKSEDDDIYIAELELNVQNKNIKSDSEVEDSS